MNEMSQSDLKELGEEIFRQIVNRDYAVALEAIEQIPLSARTPLVLSAYALCMAAVQGSYKNAVNLCHEAIKKDPKNPEHYYRQGRIFLLAGRRKDAIWVFRMGLRHGRHKEILETLAAMGLRRQPPISFLARSNPLNKYLGLLLAKLNLR
jgi:tetratricopeptide (TPR) repeat protein